MKACLRIGWLAVLSWVGLAIIGSFTSYAGTSATLPTGASPAGTSTPASGGSAAGGSPVSQGGSTAAGVGASASTKEGPGRVAAGTAPVATDAAAARASAPSSIKDASPGAAAPNNDPRVQAIREDVLRYMVIGAAVLGLGAVVLLGLWLRGLAVGWVAFSTQWGGFGGGLGGWSISPPAAALVASLVLAALAVFLLVEVAEHTDPNRGAQVANSKVEAVPEKTTSADRAPTVAEKPAGAAAAAK